MLILAAQLVASTAIDDLPIIDLSTCDEQCEQFIPEGFLGDFAPTRALCVGGRFYVARNAVGTDTRFALIQRSEIRWIPWGGSRWPNAAEIRISGYEQTIHSEGAATADPVDVTIRLIYDEEVNRLIVLRPNAATETFVRCPSQP